MEDTFRQAGRSAPGTCFPYRTTTRTDVRSGAVNPPAGGLSGTSGDGARRALFRRLRNRGEPDPWYHNWLSSAGSDGEYYLPGNGGELIYVYYGIYVIGIGGFVLEEQGYLNQYLLEHLQLLAGQIAWPIFSQLAVIGHTLFAIQFLRLHDTRRYRRWVWFGWIVSTFSGTLIVLLLAGLPLNDLSYHVSLALSFIYILLSFGYLLLAVRQKHRESYLYIVAVSPLFLAIVYAVGATVNLLPQGWLLFAIISYSPAWEITWLFVGLVSRFSFTQRQRILALEETSRLQMGMVQAIDAAQESERERIGKDLHDDIGTTLVVTKAKLGLVGKDRTTVRRYPELRKIELLIDQAISDLRTISHDLMPVEFEEYSLTEVVQQAIDRATNETIQFEFVSKGTEHRFSRRITRNISDYQ